MSLEAKQVQTKPCSNAVAINGQQKKVYTPPEPSLFIGVIGCIGGMCIQLVVGSMYQWGIINLYVTSYYKLQDPSLTVEATGIAFPLLFIMIGLMMKLGIFLSNLTHPLIVLSVCVVLESLSMFAASFMPNIWLFILFYGVFFGIMAGILFMIPMIECNKYLVGMKMLVNGIILIGTGSGSMVFGMFSYTYLNPEKLAPIKGYYLGRPELEQIVMKVPVLVRYLSLFYVGIGFLGIALIVPVILRNRQIQRERQEHERNQQAQEAAKAKNNAQVVNHQDSSQSFNPGPNQTQQAFKGQNAKTNSPTKTIEKSTDFNRKIMLPPINLKGPQQQNSPQQQQQNKIEGAQKVENDQKAEQSDDAKSGKEDNKVENKVLENVKEIPDLKEPASIAEAMQTKLFWISVLMLWLGASGCFMLNGNYKTYVRIQINDDEYLTIVGVIGAFANGFCRIGWNYFFSKTGYKTTVLTILTVAIIVYSTIRFSTSSKAGYLIEIFLINCSLGGFLVSTPTSLLSIYGPLIGANIYGIYWTNFGLANLTGYFLVSQLSKVIGFDNVIYVCLGMSVLSGIILVTTKFEGPWLNDTAQLEYCINLKVQKKEESQKQPSDSLQESSQEINQPVQGKEPNNKAQTGLPIFIEIKTAQGKREPSGNSVLEKCS